MTNSTFNILEYNKKLKAAGVPEEQADLQTGAIHELIDEKIVTKHDMLLLQKDILGLQKDILALEVSLKDVRLEMRWLFGATGIILTLVMTVLKLFH